MKVESFHRLRFVLTSFSKQPQSLFVFLQSEAGSNNKQDKIESRKYQSHECIFINEIDKYIVFCFFDEKIGIFILKFDLENPLPNENMFFQDANFLPDVLTKED